MFGANIELQGGNYGNAIFSRWPIRKHHNYLLPSYGDGEQRGVLDALVESPFGSVRVLATHLAHRSEELERIASMKVLSLQDETTPIGMKCTDLIDLPTLLVGDLNAGWGSEEIEEILKTWSLPQTEPLPIKRQTYTTIRKSVYPPFGQ